MLALIAIACCVVLPLIVAGLAVIVGKTSGSKIELPNAPPLDTAYREDSRRRRGQP